MFRRTLHSIVSTRPLVTAMPQTSVLDAVKAMHAKAIGSVLVVDGHGKLAGIFTERDLLNRVVAVDKDPATTLLSEVMTHDVMGLESDKPLSHALHMMHQNGFRHVPVLHHGQPIGMVSARDALGIEWQEFEHEMRIADDIAEILA